MLGAGVKFDPPARRVYLIGAGVKYDPPVSRPEEYLGRDESLSSKEGTGKKGSLNTGGLENATGN